MLITIKPDDTATSVTYDDQSPLTDLGDGLAIHNDTKVIARGWEYDIDIHVGVVNGRLGAERIVIGRGTSPTAVTSEALRRLPIATMVRYAADAVRYTGERHDTEPWSGPAWPTVEEGQYVKAHGPDDSTLRIVARVYRIAYLLGDSPTKKVETVFELPRSTAGRWVASARTAGYLSKAEGPGKAGG